METPVVPPATPARSEPAATWPQLDLPNVLWFFGAVVAAAASLVIIDKIPESSDDVWEFLGSLGFLVAYALAAGLLLWRGWRTPGGLLAGVAAAMVPPTGYGLTQVTGVYPDDPFFEPLSEFSGAVFGIGCVTILAGLLAYVATGVTFNLLLVVGAVQVTAQLLASAWHASGEGRSVIAVVVGAVLVLIGLALDRASSRSEAFWLYLGGLGGITVALAYLSFASGDTESRGWLPLLIGGAIVLLLAAPLRRRVWATFGAAWVGAALIHYLQTKGHWFAYLLLGLALAVFAAGLAVHQRGRRAVEVR
jgi:hypothetical protein